MIGDVLAGLAFFLVFGIAASLTAWGFKTFVDYRRWLRQSKIQTDAHSKLLDRLTSNEDLLAYIQSPAGRQFLEAAPCRSDRVHRPSARRSTGFCGQFRSASS